MTGDAVNVADRLQKAAEPGEVLAGERTAAAAAGAFEFGTARAVGAKGKPGGVDGVPVVRALGTMRPRGVAGLRRVFVGRDSELELLRATYRRAATTSEPHLVTLVGEPGVGKSRLVRELLVALAGEESAPTVRTGRCLAYGDGITYWPLGEIVREQLALREGASAEDLEQGLAGREFTRRSKASAAALAPICGLSWRTTVMPSRSASSKSSKPTSAVGRAAPRSARSAPIVWRLLPAKTAVGRRSAGSASRSRTTASDWPTSCEPSRSSSSRTGTPAASSAWR